MALPLAVDVNVGDSFETALNTIFDFLPKLIAALVILLVGYLIARLLGRLTVKLLDWMGVDKRLGDTSAGGWLQRYSPRGSMSRLIGAIVYWVLFLGVISLSLTALEIKEVTRVVASVYNYIPNLVAALVILLVAVVGAGFVANLIRKAMDDSASGRLVAQIVQIVILVLASFMMLNQLNIANDIVVITYAAIVGAVAVASALAFGLGGRGSAERLLNEIYEQKYAQRKRSGPDI